MSAQAKGITDYIIERLSSGIGADRIISLTGDSFAYVDVEDQAIYLVTVHPARLIPSSEEAAR